MCQYDNGAATVAIGNNGSNNFAIVASDILAAAGGGGSKVPLYMLRTHKD